MLIEDKLLTTAFYSAGEDRIEKVKEHLPYYMSVYEINTAFRIAGFFANLAIESNDLRQLEENLNWSVEALKRTFGPHRISRTDCYLYGRATGQFANKEMIANRIYGGEWGKENLGNDQVGDGYKYRGRGLIQLTGKDNYRAFGREIGDENLLLEKPEILLIPQYAVWSSCWFWKMKGINQFADENDIIRMRKRVNGGLIHLDKVAKRYEMNLNALVA